MIDTITNSIEGKRRRFCIVLRLPSMELVMVSIIM